MYSVKILNLSYDIYGGVSMRIWSDGKPTQRRRRNSQYQLVSMYCHVLYTLLYYCTTRVYIYVKPAVSQIPLFGAIDT